MKNYEVTSPNGIIYQIWDYSAVSAITWYAGINYGYGWKAKEIK